MEFLSKIEDSVMEQMSDSASSVRGRRNMPEPKNVGQLKAEFEDKLAAANEEIGRLWEKIYDLQNQEREMEKQG